MTALGLGALLFALAGACSPAPTPSIAAASPDPTDAPAAGLGPQYTCGAPFTFGPELLLQAPGDELAQTPLAAALRASVGRANPDVDGVLPKSGWILVGERGPDAQFIAPDGDEDLYVVSLARPNGDWRVAGWGSCQPTRVMPPGMNIAEWVMEPGQEIGPDTRSFAALVTERECASGESSEDRVVEPEIVLSEDRALVTFAVRALPGDAFTCQGNPATRVTVELPEPLGSRQLLDGSSLPARDPVQVECCG